MPISADQSAVLEMLLTGGQSYDDLDDLFGLDEGEARERARVALEELGGADPDRNVGLSDYLLGQADPIGRADAVRHLRQDASDRDLADVIVGELSDHFPEAELPKLPQAPTGSRFGGRQAAAPTQPAGEPLLAKESSGSFSPRQTRLFAALGGGAILLIVVVLAIAGVFSGNDEAPASSSEEPTAEAPADPLDPSTPIPDGEEISRVPLTSPNGGDAGGAAVVGISGGVQGYLDLVLSDIPDAPKDKAYLAWFMFNDDQGYPLAVPIVPKNGKFEGRFPIPQEVSQPIAQFSRAIEVSLSNPEEILAAAQDAQQKGTFEINRPGDTVVRGDIPEAQTPSGDQQAPGEGGGADNG
jgi:hypothetical protein